MNIPSTDELNFKRRVRRYAKKNNVPIEVAQIKLGIETLVESGDPIKKAVALLIAKKIMEDVKEEEC